MRGKKRTLTRMHVFLLFRYAICDDASETAVEREEEELVCTNSENDLLLLDDHYKLILMIVRVADAN